MVFVGTLPPFPISRPRRLRKFKFVRDIVSETKLTVDSLIYPIFVKDGIEEPEPIHAMPSQYRWPINEKLIKFLEEKVVGLGIKSILIFGIPKSKDSIGSEAYRKDGVVQKAVKIIKEVFGDKLVVITDVCLCQYTDHGHCGIVKQLPSGKYVIDNDESIKLHAKIALSHAEAGAGTRLSESKSIR